MIMVIVSYDDGGSLGEVGVIEKLVEGFNVDLWFEDLGKVF